MADYKLVNDQNGSICGLWLRDTQQATDPDAIALYLTKHDAPASLQQAAAARGYRVVPNVADNAGGCFVMFGSAPAPGEDRKGPELPPQAPPPAPPERADASAKHPAMPPTVGVDLGSESIKGVVLQARRNGPAEVVAAGTLPLGDLGHMEESADKTLALGVKLKELVRGARLTGARRRIGAGGKNSAIKYLQVPPVPPWRLDMLVKYEVQERAAEKDASTYDYRILDVPEVGGQYTVMIGVIKENAATDLLAIGRAGGLGEVEVDLEALALYNAYYHGHGYDPDKTVLIADVGADDLTIILCRNGVLYMARTLLGAGRRFTQVLADELKLDLAEAEELKKTQGEISFDIASAPSRTGRFTRGPGATGVMSRGPSGAVRSSTAGPPPIPLAGGPENGKLPAPPPAPAPQPDALADAPEDMSATGETLAGAQALTLQPLSRGQAAGETPTGNGPPTVMIAAPSQSGTTIRPQGAGPETVDDRRKRQVSMALVREAAALCAALENVVLLAKQQNKLRDLKVDRVYLTGGGSRLKGLQEFLSRRMRVEVMLLEPFRQLSLKRLAPEQARALKAEQHTLAIATGLALADLQAGSLSFLLWPDALRQRKTFWARGAYLYYAASLLVLAGALSLFTPFRNTQVLKRNFEFAEDAFNKGQTENADLRKLEVDNDERRNQLKQIAENTLSGHFFLNLLAELKSTNRIPDDIYLTQISTSMPQVVLKSAADEAAAMEKVGAAPAAPVAPKSTAETGPAPDTFQMQRIVYLRGFVRATEKGEGMILKIQDFYGRRLVPFPDDPGNPANLFKDVRPIWFSTEDYKHGQFYLTEFVLEAYTEGTREKATKKDAAGGKAASSTAARRVIGPEAGAAPAPVVAQPAPVVAQPAPVAPAVQPAPVAPAVKPVAPAVQPAPVEPEGGNRPPVRRKFIVPDAPAKAAAPEAGGKKE